MALTILPQPQQPPSFGQRLGEALGSGLGSGIQQFAQHKIDQLNSRVQHEKVSKGLQALGFSPKEAQQVAEFDPETVRTIAREKIKSSQRASVTGPGLQALMPDIDPKTVESLQSLPPGLQLEAYRNYLKTVPEEAQGQMFGGMQQQPQQEQSPLVQGLSGLGESPVQPQMQAQQQPDEMEQLRGMDFDAFEKQFPNMTPEQRQSVQDLRSVFNPKTGPPVGEEEKSAAKEVRLLKKPEPKLTKANAPKIVEKRLDEESKAAIPREDFPVKEEMAEEPVSADKKLTSADRLSAARKAKLPAKEQGLITKKNFALDEQIDADYNDAVKTLHRTKRWEQLIKSGELPSSNTKAFLNAISGVGGALGTAVGGLLGRIGGIKGISIGASAGGAIGYGLGGGIKGVVERGNPSLNEFNELVQEQMKEEAKAYKGQGSVSDYEQRMRLASLPDWLNNDLGNMRILDQLNNKSELKVVMHDAKERVLKRNGGRIPNDYSAQLEKEAAPAKQKLFNKYRYGRQFINLPLPAELPVGFEFTDSGTGIKYKNDGDRFEVVDGPNFKDYLQSK